LSAPPKVIVDVERNALPCTTSVKPLLPAVADGGTSDPMTGRATVRCATFDVRLRSATVTSSDAAVTISLEMIEVDRLPVVESNCVKCVTPPTLMTDDVLKPVPFTVSVKPLSPAATLDGVMEVMAGE